MSKDIVVHIWCDPCAKEGRQESATTTPPIIIGSAKPRTLDLCEAHRKEYLDTLSDLLGDDGAVVDARLAAPSAAPVKRARARTAAEGDERPGPFDCLVPGCTGRNNTRMGGPGYKNLHALKAHLRFAHFPGGLTYEDYVQTYGRPQPLGEGSVPGFGEGSVPAFQDVAISYPAEDVEIPDHGPNYLCGINGCEVSYPPEKYNMPKQALGMHRARIHGVRGSVH